MNTLFKTCEILVQNESNSVPKKTTTLHYGEETETKILPSPLLLNHVLQ